MKKRFLFWSAALAFAALAAAGCEDRSPSAARRLTPTGAGGHASTSSGGVGGGGAVGSSVASASASSGGPACPPDMALAASFCIDRWEAPNQLGEKPLVMQSAVLAESWCAKKGKRLCTEDEWDTACEGPDQ